MSKTNWTNFVHLLQFENNKFSPQKYLFSVYIYTHVSKYHSHNHNAGSQAKFWFYLWFLHMTYTNTHI